VNVSNNQCISFNLIQITFITSVLWFNPSQRLNIMQLLTHSSPAPVAWGGELKKVQLLGGDTV